MSDEMEMAAYARMRWAEDERDELLAAIAAHRADPSPMADDELYAVADRIAAEAGD